MLIHCKCITSSTTGAIIGYNDDNNVLRYQSKQTHLSNTPYTILTEFEENWELQLEARHIRVACNVK